MRGLQSQREFGGINVGCGGCACNKLGREHQGEHLWVLQDQQEGWQEASPGCSPAPGGGCGGAGATGGCESFVQPSPCTRCF